MIKKIAWLLLIVIVGAIAVVWIGALASLDWDRKHQQAVEHAPIWPAAKDGEVRIPAGGFEFRARVAGFDGTRGNLLMLHGFPETSMMWEPLIEQAARAGYRVVAFDQRGYSPGARPEGRDQYTMDRLTGDVLAVADAVGFETFHLVGHDWGAAVGWALTLGQPERVTTWSALSIPHIAAFGEALQNDPEQRSRSSYMGFFWLPWIPEQTFSFNNFAALKDALYTEQSPAVVEEYIGVLSEPGALTGALNWYRAPQGDSGLPGLNVSQPVLFVWGNQDRAVSRVAVDLHRQYMPKAYREIELDAGHWLMSSHGDIVSEAVLQHVGG